MSAALQRPAETRPAVERRAWSAIRDLRGECRRTGQPLAEVAAALVIGVRPTVYVSLGDLPDDLVDEVSARVRTILERLPSVARVVAEWRAEREQEAREARLYGPLQVAPRAATREAPVSDRVIPFVSRRCTETLREIRVGVRIDPMADELEDAILERAPLAVFQRSGSLVRVSRATGGEQRGPARLSEGAPRIEILPEASAFALAAEVAAWTAEKRTKEGETTVRVRPDWAAIRALLARGQWRFEELASVAEGPFFAPSGRIVHEAGLDTETGVLVMPGVQDPGVLDRPSRDEAIDAGTELAALFAEFPWRSTDDEAWPLALLLTLLARPAIAGPCPMFVLSKNVPGAGATLIVDAVHLVAHGRTPPRTPLPDDSEEARKALFALALEGHACVVFDNAVGTIGNPTLSAVLTGETMSDRVLGQSRHATAPTNAVMVATGNQLRFRHDLGRRVVLAELASPDEHPEDRQGFRIEDLKAHVREHRGELLRAALTILRAYHVAKRPRHGLPRKGSFEAWDRLIRGALIWAGCGDPLATTSRVREDGDADLAALRCALLAWHAAFGPRALTAGDAVREAERRAQPMDGSEPDPSLLDALSELARGRKLDGKTLGYGLRAVAGRVASGLRLEKDGDAKQGTRWVVREADQPGGWR